MFDYHDTTIPNRFVSINDTRCYLLNRNFNELSRANAWKVRFHLKGLDIKLLFKYLPKNTNQWGMQLKSTRNDYFSYIDSFIVDSVSIPDNDHPLSVNPESNWSSYFEDNLLLVQINKDCKRIRPDINFIDDPSPYSHAKLFPERGSPNALRRRLSKSKIKSQAIVSNICGGSVSIFTRKTTSSSFLSAGLDDSLISDATSDPTLTSKDESEYYYQLLEPDEETHWEVIQRILYIYCKLCNQKYIQGMHEIITPIYYVMFTQPDLEDRPYCEVDTFFCFNDLMVELYSSYFLRELDNQGISLKMNQFERILSHSDPQLYEHLKKLRLENQYFAFRWISLLFSQEFGLITVVNLWDYLLSDDHRFDLVLFVCVAMLILKRDELLSSDFSGAMQLVLNFPEIDIKLLVKRAYDIYAKPNPIGIIPKFIPSISFQ